ncbi:dehydrogenase [Saccharomonospora sp. CUA-673]|uniref:FAD-binding oxidoreductase n=1 Tax=Saccharomonospora sp. CUA-673 TaxID=1904969 RepID=UPI00095B223A|nr:FAD-binding protein [Saccharomonospora sp. CUA-673]OLT44208.1 dehydrogenase [Saccharomonospora sp. CUA-673]
MTTTLTPTDLSSAGEAMAKSEGTVRIQGADTAHGWAGTPGRADTVLDTTGLTGLLAYNPADMTISVLAGTPLETVQRQVARHGQRVAFDAARVRRGATVGGLIATADSGPLAPAYGSLRDLVIGATVVLADGTIARTGGHVIKNVAGYDLTKLLHGSYGAFGLLAEVVLRLHPLTTHRTVRRTCTLDEAIGHTRTLMASALEPVSLEWVAGTLLARIEGTTAGTDARAADLADLIDGTVLPEDEAATEWERHAALVDGATVRLGCRPSRLAEVLADRAGPVVAGLASGVATVTAPGTEIDDLHDRVTAAGGTSVTRHRPDGTGRAWGQRPSALGVVRALKHELDPDRRLCSGRFESWLEPADTTSSAVPRTETTQEERT